MRLLPDGVYIARFDKAKFLSIYRKTKGLQSMFPDIIDFVVWISSHDTIVLETGGGLIIFYEVEPHVGCKVLAFFNDGKMSTRTELVKSCLLWAFATFDLLRVSVWVPSSFLAFIRWVKDRLGFKEDGRLRGYARSGNRPISYVVLSLMCEEVL